MARTHVVMDDDLLEEIDRVAGERGRSRFLEEAAREKLKRTALEGALDETFGLIRGKKGYEHWSDERAARAWVGERRKGRRSE